MNNPESIWTSTGSKFMYHPDVIKKLIEKGKGTPISLQVAPTSKCQLNCIFCSNANRERHEELDPAIIIKTLHELTKLGLKTVEWTGGGDPTLYPHINAMIIATHLLCLEQGFITNGVNLDKLSPAVLFDLKWIRISMNCLDYVDEINIPKIPGVLGFSYVMNEKTTDAILCKIHKYVGKHEPKYVRIVPNCQASFEEQEKNNKKWSKIVSTWGEPYFYQAKTFSKPEHCWWGYFKPFINFNGDVFRCSSVVLNSDSDKTFHKKYRWCDILELPAIYKKTIEDYKPISCDNCVFHNQNDMITELLETTGMEAFI